MGKGGGGGGDAVTATALRRSPRSKADAIAGARGAEGPARGALPRRKDRTDKPHQSWDDDERDRPERFTGPEPVLPTRWWHAVHHALVLTACVCLHVSTYADDGPRGGGFFHSIPLTLIMVSLFLFPYGRLD